jgi:hypothetical protein
MQDLTNQQLDHPKPFSAPVSHFVRQAKTLQVTDDLLKRCLRPLQQLFQTKIRLAIGVPICNNEQADFLRSRKYLVVLNRLVFRTPRQFIEHLVTKFGLPTALRQDACLVIERQDRIVSDLSQLFDNDYLVLLKEPAHLEQIKDERTKGNADPTLQEIFGWACSAV